jgi:hypothetical protein
MGFIAAGMGLASMFMGNKSAKAEQGAINQGFDYMKSNPLMQQAQTQGGEAMGLRGALLGLGGDQEAAEQGFQQYQDSTGYQFRMEQGQNAITGSRAARGILNSGASAKALTRFGQDFGSAEYEKYLGQLGQTADTGLEAAGLTGRTGAAAGEATAGSIANNTQNQMSGLGGLVKGIGSIFGF